MMPELPFAFRDCLLRTVADRRHMVLEEFAYALLARGQSLQLGAFRRSRLLLLLLLHGIQPAVALLLLLIVLMVMGIVLLLLLLLMLPEVINLLLQIQLGAELGNG